MTYNSLQGIFTTMIGFVTWPPFCTGYHLLSCKVGNAHDLYAVKVMKAGTRAVTMVGHLPKKTSSTCSLFIRKGGTIDYEVTDPN